MRGLDALLVRASSAVVKIDTYVINLRRRTDRCRCLAAQLLSAPTPVYRQDAVGSGECGLQDDSDTLYGGRNHTSEKSLFCSNYKVWERASTTDADFALILEDDVVLAPQFWDQIMALASSCQHFNYVAVDSWKHDGNPGPDRVDVCGGYTDLFKPDPAGYLGYWGTHAQLIRTTYLQKMIGQAKLHGMGPMDVWWMMRVNDGTAFSWQPGIARQAAQKLLSSNFPECDPSVSTSDIATFAERELALPRLQCP